MANKRLPDPTKRRYGICGCVEREVINKFKQEAGRRGVKVGVLVGMVLDEWAEGVRLEVGRDERQEEMFGGEEVGGD
jgi:hypothetical protein